MPVRFRGLDRRASGTGAKSVGDEIMEWLILFCIVVWVLVIQNRLRTAERQILSLRVAQPDEAAAVSASPRIAPEPRPAAQTWPLRINPAPPVSTAAPTPPRQPAAKPAAIRPALSNWLAENALAWVGGGALALGGALLVAYAAERGFFTPGLRILASIALGAAMLATGEWLRRATRAPGGRHALAAAVTSGAGASTLYAAIWAAYALYHFIPLTEAAVLLAAVSLGLLALAVLHGEALAILALGGAFATPVVCDPAIWSSPSLDGYLALITATGLAATSLRGWSRAGLLTLAGVGLWLLNRQLSGDVHGAETLLIGGLAVTLLAVKYRNVRLASASEPGAADRMIFRLPLIACIGSTAFWVLSVPAMAGLSAPDLALVGFVLSVLCAAASQMRLTSDRVVLAPAIGLAVIAVTSSDYAGLTHLPHLALWLLAPIAALTGSSLALRLADGSRSSAGVIGAAGGALALTLLGPPLATALPSSPGLLFVTAAGLFAIGAWLIVRRSGHAASDPAVAAWVLAGAETLGVAIHASLPGRPEPAAYGLLALGLALVARRLPWRGLTEAAALACLIGLMSILGPRIAVAVFTGGISWSDVALAGGAGVLAQTACWCVLCGRPDATRSRETASTSAALSGLLTLFLVLHGLAAGHAAQPANLSDFAETSFRTVLFFAAGLMLSMRGGQSVLSRARGPVLLAAGALHGLLLQMLLLNPWWGLDGGGQIPGPPVVDILAVAFLAPALILAAAARRQTTSLKWAAPGTALTALLYLMVWAAMEIRRLFHGPALAEGAFGYGEVVAYGVALMGTAWLVSLNTVQKAVLGDSSNVAKAVALVARWSALCGSVLLICGVASPWWGPLDGALRAPIPFFALIALALLLTALFTRQAAARASRWFSNAIKIAVVLEAFNALTLVIRFAFHGAAMRLSNGEAGAETWTYSAAWAAWGILVLTAGARGGDRTLRWLGLGLLTVTTLKVFLFDMATLQGAIRAASFLALGALLIIGAVIARRLGARTPI